MYTGDTRLNAASEQEPTTKCKGSVEQEAWPATQSVLYSVSHAAAPYMRISCVLCVRCVMRVRCVMWVKCA